MVRLLPILPLPWGKFERKTKPLPAFYLAETSDGSRGVLGAIEPKTLLRIQRSVSSAAVPRSYDEFSVFHGVYWGDDPLPDSLANVLSGMPSLRPIPKSAEEEVTKYLSKVTVCVVGDEAKLDAAIAAGANTVRIALWDAKDPKLPWLSCHRVLRNVDDFRAGWMVCLAREHMFFRDVTSEIHGTSCGNHHDTAAVVRLLRSKGNESITIIAISNEGAWRVHTQPGWADGLLADLHPSVREIAAVQLDHILLARGLDLSPHDVSRDHHLKVVHRAEDAIAQLRDGAQVVYLLQPIRSAQLQELIKHGQMLPANSVALDVAALEVWNDVE
jgi:hypothetical protein